MQGCAGVGLSTSPEDLVHRYLSENGGADLANKRAKPEEIVSKLWQPDQRSRERVRTDEMRGGLLASSGALTAVGLQCSQLQRTASSAPRNCEE